MQVIGCITASWIPVLMRSSRAVPALLGLLGCLPGLLGFLLAKPAFLGLARGEVAGTNSGAEVLKKGSSWIFSRLSEPEAAYPAYAVSCVRARNSAIGRASLPKC